MATSTYIISVNDFLNRTDLSPNISTNILQGFYAAVQETELVGVICQQMYDDIIGELSNGGEAGLSTEYQNLLPYLKDFLVWATMVEYYPISGAKSTPAGMRKHTDTISEESDKRTLDLLTKRAKSKMRFYQDKMINFLEENESSYPLWKDSRCNCNAFSKPSSGIRFSSNKSTKTRIKYT